MSLPPAKILLATFDSGQRKILSLLLKEIGFEVLPAVTDVPTGLQLFIEHGPDICLIYTGWAPDGLSGIDLAEKIRVRGSTAPIIFLTDNYTEEAYRQVRHVRPSGFMSKELSSFKLRHAVELALLGKPDESSHNQKTPPSLPTNPSELANRQYFFKVDDHYAKIPIDEVTFFFAEGRLTYARVESRNLPTNVPLKTLIRELTPAFHRIHKKYLINVNRIDYIYPKDSIVEIGSESLPIGYAYRKAFLKRMNLLK